MPMSNTGLLTGTAGSGGGAANALGLGSDLQNQVLGETEEQRKKRLQQQQQQALLGSSGSMAVSNLFGRGLSGSASTF